LLVIRRPLAATLVRVFKEKNVPLFVKPAVQAPMRVLMGANMPAVLIELAFMSNGADEALLGNADWQAGIVDGVLAALTELRRGGPGGVPTAMTTGMKVAIGSGVLLLAGGLWLVTLVPGWLSHEPGAAAPASSRRGAKRTDGSRRRCSTSLTMAPNSCRPRGKCRTAPRRPNKRARF
jgi:hypothetical protein